MSIEDLQKISEHCWCGIFYWSQLTVNQNLQDATINNILQCY